MLTSWSRHSGRPARSRGPPGRSAGTVRLEWHLACEAVPKGVVDRPVWLLVLQVRAGPAWSARGLRS